MPVGCVPPPPPGPGTPQDQAHPLGAAPTPGARHPPEPGTPHLPEQTPLEQTPLQGMLEYHLQCMLG